MSRPAMRPRARRAARRRPAASPIGCGIDIVDLARFRRSVKQGGRAFLARIYTDAELRYAESHHDPIPHLAARFAAKEAVMKAVSQIRPGPMPAFTQIEIVNDALGRPRAIIGPRGTPDVYISLSHDQRAAVASAFVLAALRTRARPPSRRSAR